VGLVIYEEAIFVEYPGLTAWATPNLKPEVVRYPSPAKWSFPNLLSDAGRSGSFSEKD